MSAARPSLGKSLCAHTEFECDCDCQCAEGKDTVHCGWPDCGCGCEASCVGCAMEREKEAANYG